MKLCAYCRAPVVESKTRDYCSDVCREEAALDAKRPTKPTTMAHIDIALARARAGMS